MAGAALLVALAAAATAATAEPLRLLLLLFQQLLQPDWLPRGIMQPMTAALQQALQAIQQQQQGYTVGQICPSCCR
jgi:hypothetical protein